jgi:Uncharacterised protein family (UPF0175)
VAFQVPDDLATRMNADGNDLSRRALALDEFKIGRITTEALRRMLGYTNRYQLDGLLKNHGVFYDYPMEDFEREQETLSRLGF